MSSSGNTVVHQHKTFSNVDYTEKRLVNREFVQCEFVQCNFTGSDLRNNDFEGCHFTQCNFSMTIIDSAGFRDARFTSCKILGVDFTRCNKFMFSFAFTESHLDYCTFFGTKLKKTVFQSCSLKETDFTEADLSGAAFHNCDLTRTKFMHTLLEKADFRTAQNFSIDPEVNRLKKARFSAAQLAGLLDKYQLDIE